MTKEDFNNIATNMFVAINKINSRGYCTRALLSKHFGSTYDMFSPSHNNRYNKVLKAMLEDNVVMQYKKPLGHISKQTTVFQTSMSGIEFDKWLTNCEPPAREIRGGIKKPKRVARSSGRSKGSYLIKQILKTHGLKQKELAERIGVDQGVISRLCTGKAKITPAFKERLIPFIDYDTTDENEEVPTKAEPTHKLAVIDTSELLVDTIMGAIGSYI